MIDIKRLRRLVNLNGGRKKLGLSNLYALMYNKVLTTLAY